MQQLQLETKIGSHFAVTADFVLIWMLFNHYSIIKVIADNVLFVKTLVAGYRTI
jgi:hypothetical protein